MNLLEIENLRFTYPDADAPTLKGVSLSVRPGEFVALCGASGSGKSTLLRHLKPAIAPKGETEGRILFGGTALERLSARDQAAKIGFVAQQPDGQIATDKVWHELSFAPESLGMDREAIRRRVAETAAYFGMQTWFDRDTDSLSGGQKQLLNLAAAMVMRPELLVLDEPVSRLDPIAAREFVESLGRLNRETGLTVVIAEHNLDEVLALCDRLIVLDGGEILFDGPPDAAGAFLAENRHPMALSMPAPMRIYAACADGQPCPVSVRDGRSWIDGFARAHSFGPLPETKIPPCGGKSCIAARELWFRYPDEERDVLRGASLKLYPGQWLAVLGGNGSGKSTLMKLLSGRAAAWRGSLKIDRSKRIALLPQEPKAMFRAATVGDELNLKDVDDAAWLRAVTRCRLENLLDRHPFDLSGGECQRAALAKLLLAEPDILLMDEPTKGMDAENKRAFAEIIDRLCADGVAVLMVSHDLEFCADHAHRCVMLFDGQMQCENTPRAFFSDNRFYTTAAHRMVGHRIAGAVTVGDVVAACGGSEPTIPPAEPPQPPQRPVRRGPGSPLKPLQCSGVKLRAKKSMFLMPALLAATLLAGTFLLGGRKYMLTSLAMLAEILGFFFISFEKKRPGAREVALVAALCALGVAGRSAFFMLPQFKPVAALAILCAAAYGPETGFLIGAGTMLASNLFFGQGPWTPWQMCAMGLVGYFTGLIFRKRTCRLALCLWGGAAVFCVYGLMVNVSSAITYQPELTWSTLLPYIVSGVPFDLIHAGGTMIFLWLLAEPAMEKLRRVKQKFGLRLS